MRVYYGSYMTVASVAKKARQNKRLKIESILKIIISFFSLGLGLRAIYSI